MTTRAFVRKQVDSKGRDVVIVAMISHELAGLGEEGIIEYSVNPSLDMSVITLVEVARSNKLNERESTTGLDVDQILLMM